MENISSKCFLIMPIGELIFRRCNNKNKTFLSLFFFLFLELKTFSTSLQKANINQVTLRARKNSIYRFRVFRARIDRVFN